MKTFRWCLAIVTFLCHGVAFALTPAEVFQKVSPSVWAVRGLDDTERPVSYGSAVVVQRGQVATTCRVVHGAKFIQVRRENVIFLAKIAHADYERDLCLLSITGFNAAPVEIVGVADLKIGQSAYAINSPKGVSQSLSDGLISGLRSSDGKQPLVQTTAALSEGASGGGLFDDRGRLIAITTLSAAPRGGLNFGIPAQWIAEVPERARQQVGRTPEQTLSGVASSSGAVVPVAGNVWVYHYRDKILARRGYPITIRVDSVSGTTVSESLQVEGENNQDLAVDTHRFGFIGRALPRDRILVELAPYLRPADLKADQSKDLKFSGSYPVPKDPFSPWVVKRPRISEEEMTVPAGRFRTTRVELTGLRETVTPFSDPVRFWFQAWYAPEVGRYVKLRHRAWNGYGQLDTDETVELKEIRKKL